MNVIQFGYYQIILLTKFIYLKNRRVITSIRHITPWKVNKIKNHFNTLNNITDIFYTNNKIAATEMKKYLINQLVIPLYHNEGMEIFE